MRAFSRSASLGFEDNYPVGGSDDSNASILHCCRREVLEVSLDGLRGHR
jgi:hypothetical protein